MASAVSVAQYSSLNLPPNCRLTSQRIRGRPAAWTRGVHPVQGLAGRLLPGRAREGVAHCSLRSAGRHAVLAEATGERMPDQMRGAASPGQSGVPVTKDSQSDAHPATRVTAALQLLGLPTTPDDPAPHRGSSWPTSVTLRPGKTCVCKWRPLRRLGKRLSSALQRILSPWVQGSTP